MFSVSEQKFLTILGLKKMTIKEITKKFYDGKPPHTGNIRVASLVRRVQQKCDENELPWTIAGVGLGRQGKTVWLEEK